MAEKQFSKGEAIDFGWKTVNNNLGLFVALILVIFVANFIPLFLTQQTQYAGKSGLLIWVSIRAVLIVINSLMIPGMIKICLDFCDGKQGRSEDLFAYTHLFFSCLAGAILCVFAIGVAIWGIGPIVISALSAEYFSNFSWGASMGLFFIMMIMSAMTFSIIFWMELQFFTCFLVDKNMSAIESFKKSCVMVRGSWGELFVFAFLLALINIVGLLCLRIGLIMTIPQTCLAIAYVYRKLTAEPNVVAPVKLSE
jgi:hypothetical protein